MQTRHLLDEIHLLRDVDSPRRRDDYQLLIAVQHLRSRQPCDDEPNRAQERDGFLGGDRGAEYAGDARNAKPEGRRLTRLGIEVDVFLSSATGDLRDQGDGVRQPEGRPLDVDTALEAEARVGRHAERAARGTCAAW